MTEDIIQRLWDEGRKEPTMTKAEIQALLRPHVRKNAFGLGFLLWVYLVFIAGTLVCEGMGIYAFRTNPVMLAVLITMALFTLGFLAYGIHMVGELASIDRGDDSLVTVLRRRLRFYGRKHDLWLWMVAFTLVFLSFAVSTMLDCEDGSYRINKPGLFIAFTTLQLLFGYTIFKIGHYPLLRELKAILSDLEHQVTVGTEQIKVLKRRWRWWSVLLAILGVVFLILGILKATGWPG